MLNRKLNVFLPLLFAIVLALGMYLGHQMPGSNSGAQTLLFSRAPQGPLQEVMDLLKVKYVDTLQVADLQQEAIEGLLGHLDPHSVYIPPSNVEEVNEDLDGAFQGIGVEFNITADTVNIISVIAGGPSESAGVKTGDKIIKVNDSLVAGNGITADKIRKLLRGPKESKVVISMLRQQKIQQIQITRGVIPLYSVDASYMITPEIGYIKISKFAGTTYQEFIEAMRKLQKTGMTKLVIDLRQNPGGYLDAATRIADELLDDNKLILYTKGKSYPRTDYDCEKPGLFERGALAILADEGSASASEILAGAVQDWDRGTIIGRRTFGKGLVQEQFDLSNGGALRLTVARYYTPSGRSIQKSYANGREAYDEDIMNRFNHGEFVNKDSIKQLDTVQYKTAKGRVVYGGGGITPDVFIPFDTSRFSNVIASMYARSTFSNFAYQYYNSHRDQFKGYKDAGVFSKQFELNNDIYNAYKNFAAKDSVRGIETIKPHDEVEIRTRLKALLARQIWSYEGFYESMNKDDEMVKKAVGILQTEK
ncbi:carboxyl-terminal processing protease [Chitinophaga sp. YR573]|uniref:S41 family peptidase n=1 Tax=Chitinophaga sp. YR573 TaxID=1881040 RepID=UPI0008D650D0|nr:S41 family peptidase [Chitinophaga sp. YR573]SEV94067.1 carboxyl-terminal processing protease [Chitinophaga sp. YR573]